MDKKLTDEELVVLAQDGDSEAEEQLYNRYKPKIKLEIRPYYLVGGDSDDLIQVAMIGLMNAIRNYKSEGKASFRTYATYCIRNRIISEITSANRNKHQPIANYVSFYTKIGKKGEDGEELQLMDTLEAGPESDPVEVVLDREEHEEKRDAMKNKLSPMERSVAGLYIEGYSVSEIAVTLDKEEKGVNNALFRIRKKLKSELERQNKEEEKPETKKNGNKKTANKKTENKKAENKKAENKKSDGDE